MIGEIPISDACHYMDAHDTETYAKSDLDNDWLRVSKNGTRPFFPIYRSEERYCRNKYVPPPPSPPSPIKQHIVNTITKDPAPPPRPDPAPIVLALHCVWLTGRQPAAQDRTDPNKSWRAPLVSQCVLHLTF